MPEHVTLNELRVWSQEFLEALGERAGKEKVALLMETYRHQFESIERLKFLRNFLSNEWRIKSCISKAAFVQPRQNREPEVASPKEAYFSVFTEAHNWLRQQLN